MAASLQPSLSFIHVTKIPKAPLISSFYVHNLHTKQQRWLQCKPIKITSPLKSKLPSRLARIGASANSSELSAEPPKSLLYAKIYGFFDLINQKEITEEELDKLISVNCIFDDLAFQNPFKGNKEIFKYLKDLKKAMGKQIVFKIDQVYEGRDEAVGGVLWHLEWNDLVIPFTKGCSLFHGTKHDETEDILIDQVRIFEESPLKPGKVAVELLKLVSSYFDKYPESTKRFLNKFDEITKWIVKVCKNVMDWIIVPFLKYQTNLWGCAFKILQLLGNLLLKLLNVMGLI
ncbi:uncharacterized protein LOC120250172 [Dioscorea cayenensis subsp. rotundata]|uniref:Uncharacterized protein LOC120250172 n=1 Tax=Dioscorea cayennensis subsp. rotundata TaxID=55577 RepID=A0AB40AJ00_DIOCR|nr:uncharacterized protein LOC120250172 [Dioscorea cayenensis subsp. rotundata]